MTSATERLRALLDERGVEWQSPSGLASSFADSITFIGNVAVVSEIDGSDLLRINFDGTPEQAVAATLGPGTCREVKIDRYWRGCGECGYVWEFMYGIGKCERPRYCPSCGARVIGGVDAD